MATLIMKTTGTTLPDMQLWQKSHVRMVDYLKPLRTTSQIMRGLCMSDFKKWFRSLNANGKTVYFLGNEHKVSEMAWNHQQAIIDEHTEVIKLQDADLRKYEKQIESLKAQLNNMEACYIEKKKRVEELQKTNISLEAGLRKNSKNKQKLLGKDIELQKRIDEHKKLTTSIRNEFDLWSDDSEFADVIEAQIENLEALRGES